MLQSTPLTCLLDLPLETRAELTEIRGGRQLRRRLMGLGLREGSQLRVVQRRGQGLVLASDALRIAVGSGIAEKLWVTPSTAVEEQPGMRDPAPTAGAEAPVAPIDVTLEADRR